VRAMLQNISTQVADCYERAGESRARAAAAADENDKTEYLNIERRWIMRARSYELSERIMGFTEEVKRRLRVLIPPEPPHPAVPRVTCAHCGRKMRLTHIEPVVKGGLVTNTSAFACKCGFTCRQVADR
jgi:hypothetical protein